MKKLVIVGAALLSCALLPQFADARGGKTVDLDQTERRTDGLTYKIGADDPLTGLVREMYSRKKKKSEVNFVDGVRHGLSTRWWQNGEKQFSGGFVNGRPDGPRTEWYPSGNKKSEFSLVGGKVQGIKTTWFDNGNKRQEATMDDGQFHGRVVTWYEDGQKKSEENWVRGESQREGVSNHWSKGGRVYTRGSYESGKFTGKILLWSERGLSSEETFVDGERAEYAETLGKQFANGQIQGEQRWINGRRQETWWYEDGQRRRHFTVHPHSADGHFQEWYENGQEKTDYRMSHAIREGPETRWFENGQKQSVANHLHGKKHGTQTEWHEDGRIKSESHYAYGRLLDAAGEPVEPVPPKNAVKAKTATDVTYKIHIGSLRFWNTAIQSVSDGTFTGNSAVVAPGATIRMTGNWQFGPPKDRMDCPACNDQIYVSWIPDAADRGAWPPSHVLWQGMAKSVKLNSEPGGTFDWTTQAPRLPGVYYVGRGQTQDFYSRIQTEGRLGAPTAATEDRTTASFRIEVRTEAEVR